MREEDRLPERDAWLRDNLKESRYRRTTKGRVDHRLDPIFFPFEDGMTKQQFDVLRKQVAAARHYFATIAAKLAANFGEVDPIVQDTELIVANINLLLTTIRAKRGEASDTSDPATRGFLSRCK